MNKRQAKFIMQLPDDYEWAFINDNYLCGIHPEKEILIYEIAGEELIPSQIKMASIDVSSEVTSI